MIEGPSVLTWICEASQYPSLGCGPVSSARLLAVLTYGDSPMLVFVLLPAAPSGPRQCVLCAAV